jgi:hypothetical protein
MRLLWHIVLKDLRRLRLPLTIWSALQLLAIVATDFIWSLQTLPSAQMEGLINAASVLHPLSWLAAFDFTVRLIQEDSPARTDTFWRTRPISGLRLLTAKLLGLLLFALLASTPALLAILALTSASASSIFLTAYSGLSPQLVFAAFALPFATLTRSTRQCILAALIVFIVIAGATIAVHLRYDPTDTDLFPSRIALAKVIGLLSVAVVLIVQYHAGRLARSLSLTIQGTLAAILVLALWPWRFPLNLPPLPQTEPDEARTFSITFKSAHLWNYAEWNTPRPKLDLKLSASGYPPDLFISRKAIYQHCLPGTPPSYRPSSHFVTDPDARLVLGLQQSAPAPSVFGLRSTAPDEFAARLRSHHTPPYRADIVFNLHRADVNKLSLQIGQTSTTPDGSLRCLEIDPEAATIRILEHRTARRFGNRIIEIASSQNEQFILYNPRTGEIRRGTDTKKWGNVLRQHELRFGPIESANVVGRSTPFTDDFLREARLVKITFPVIGTFVRTISVDALNPYISR